MKTYLLAILLTVPATFAAAEPFKCRVTDVLLSSEENPEFVRKNKQKQFLITVGSESIVIAQSSPDFAPSEREFFPVSEPPSDILAMATDSFSVSTFAMPYLTNSGIRFDATLTLQTANFVNVWTLDCLP
ncbi:hypothetical protein [Algicella marina]|uniref:Uncharacterized protein n=1 Tax=Algicella marina TaxID=2683284 RepID=A0A6P1T5F1_9RHOB|nr:hypothetical protein [Algicella marina]QHQ36985.1 hypothetical protein GO499_18260 [Algicella marina]